MLRASLVALTVAAPVVAQPVLFDDVAVFDGESLIGTRDVLVDDGRIADVAPNIEPAEGVEIIDGRGRTLLPGFIDAHTHTMSPDMLRSAASLGVTTVLDMFTAGPTVIAVQSIATSDDAHNHADLKTATTLMTVPGGHGTQYGIEIETVSSVDDVDAFVANRVAEGADYIKIVCEDGASWGREIPTITEAMLRRAVDAAHKHDKLAVVHVSTMQWARRAVDAGADVLVHAFTDVEADDDFVSAAAASGVRVTPTFVVLESAAGLEGGAEVAEDERLSAYLTAGEVGTLMTNFRPGEPDQAMLDRVMRTVRRLHEAGVPILAGTDPPNPGTAHGASLHRELTLLVDAGLTPAEALAAATSSPADAYHLANRGRITPGARADLVLVAGDPTHDIDATRDIEGVWRLGRRVQRRAVDHNAEVERTGLVSAFEGDMDVSFGAGWVPTMDSIAGGASTCTLEVVDGGADNSTGCLRIKGVIAEGAPNPWAGAQLSPGAGVFQPADLSKASGLSFDARGDGRGYAVLVFTRSRGFDPGFAVFTPAQGEWSQHSFDWAAFGVRPGDVTAIMISASTPTGEFTLDIDNVRIK